MKKMIGKLRNNKLQNEISENTGYKMTKHPGEPRPAAGLWGRRR